MHRIMHRIILNTLSTILMVSCLYLVACLIDMQINPVNETVKNLQIVNHDNVVLSTHHDKDINIAVKRGDAVIFNVRYYTTHTAILQVKRYIVGPKGVQRELTEHKYYTTQGEIQDAQVVYPIPFNAPTGCGYTLYSRLEVSYPYNILTRIAPITKGVALGASFCITD